MKKFLKIIGTATYWLTFPATWPILNNSERSRLIMVDDGRLLVVKSWLSTGKWGLPGGGMHKNESPAESLIREVSEELGVALKPADIQLVLSEPITIRATKTLLHYFLASRPKKVKITPQKIEISEFAWLPLKSLNAKNCSEDVLRAIEAFRQNNA